ncbi:MAG: YiiX/YebB-like N1pC/P60 family cysteine hydrolase [Pseudohongiellaceae bacterium]
MLHRINRAIGRRLATFLTKSLPGYQRLDTVPVANIASVLQTGDIVLVEGNTRISVAIKYLSQSSWSHSSLFVGRPGAATSEPLLLEADLRHGVRLVSLDHYADFNLRICRAEGLTQEERQQVVDFARERLGHQYDLKNVFDLVRYLIQKPAVPNRYRRMMLGIGSGEPTRAICSTMIAEAFQSIDYPILPLHGRDVGRGGALPEYYYRRHFTHFTPRDFDLSPYFNVIKPTIVHGFDFRTLEWRDELPQKGAGGATDSASTTG